MIRHLTRMCEFERIPHSNYIYICITSVYVSKTCSQGTLLLEALLGAVFPPPGATSILNPSTKHAKPPDKKQLRYLHPHQFTMAEDWEGGERWWWRPAEDLGFTTVKLYSQVSRNNSASSGR